MGKLLEFIMFTRAALLFWGPSSFGHTYCICQCFLHYGQCRRLDVDCSLCLKNLMELNPARKIKRSVNIADGILSLNISL